MIPAGNKENRMFFYDRFANEFDSHMNRYDLNKRLRILFEELLTPGEIAGKDLLDAGCGTGWFSQKAFELGANVTSLDVGDNLLNEVKAKCNSKLVKGDVCAMEFDDNMFDYVIATEVIEHTSSPRQAIKEMHRVLKPNGVILLTVPNKIWHFSVSVANALKLRPYEGYENWVGWFELKRWLNDIGFDICKMYGFHVLPFVSPILYPIIDYFDKFRRLGPAMINIAVKGTKT